jgi:hypothetical protein
MLAYVHEFNDITAPPSPRTKICIINEFNLLELFHIFPFIVCSFTLFNHDKPTRLIPILRRYMVRTWTWLPAILMLVL